MTNPNDINLAEAYRVLYVVPGAPERVVRGAYKARAAEVHPDAGGTDEEFKRVERAFTQIASAGFPPGPSGGPELRKSATLRTCTNCGRPNSIPRGATAVSCGACGVRFFWGRRLRDEVVSLWGRIEAARGGYINFDDVASKAPVSVAALHRARRVRNDHAHGRMVSEGEAQEAYRTLRVVADNVAANPTGGPEAPEREAREEHERAAQQEREAREKRAAREREEREERVALAARREREWEAREWEAREKRAAREREEREERTAREAREREQRVQQSEEFALAERRLSQWNAQRPRRVRRRLATFMLCAWAVVLILLVVLYKKSAQSEMPTRLPPLVNKDAFTPSEGPVVPAGATIEYKRTDCPRSASWCPNARSQAALAECNTGQAEFVIVDEYESFDCRSVVMHEAPSTPPTHVERSSDPCGGGGDSDCPGGPRPEDGIR